MIDIEIWKENLYKSLPEIRVVYSKNMKALQKYTSTMILPDLRSKLIAITIN